MVEVNVMRNKSETESKTLNSALLLWVSSGGAITLRARIIQQSADAAPWESWRNGVSVRHTKRQPKFARIAKRIINPRVVPGNSRASNFCFRAGLRNFAARRPLKRFPPMSVGVTRVSEKQSLIFARTLSQSPLFLPLLSKVSSSRWRGGDGTVCRRRPTRSAGSSTPKKQFSKRKKNSDHALILMCFLREYHIVGWGGKKPAKRLLSNTESDVFFLFDPISV